MRLERDAFKTEWGASPRAQGTVKLLREISQIRAVVISLHAPETDVPARVGNGAFSLCIYLCLHPGRAATARPGSLLIAPKTTPGYAGGKVELIARGEVDKKKSSLLE
jgi:hypothetical protein